MSENLTIQQKKLIAEIIRIGKIEPACRNVGVSRTTYYAWITIPEFEQELRKQQEQIYEGAISKIQQLFVKAIDTQEKMLNSDNESIQLRAAIAIVNNTLKVIETNSIKHQLNYIEEQVDITEELIGKGGQK